MKKLEKICKYVGILLLLPTLIFFLIGDLWTYVGVWILIISIQCFALVFLMKKLEINENKYFDYNHDNSNQSKLLFPMTKDEKERYKIVEKFSDRFGLSIPEEKIQLIVDASFNSYYWAKEIYDMEKEYSRITDWYRGDTVWLRIYFHVVPHLNISSDFDLQYDYVESYYKSIFENIDIDKYSTVRDYIAEVNRKFLTSFDDVSFMTVVRLLNNQGMEIRLPKGDSIINESDIDILIKKYNV